jgi:predicted transposase YbfD/YdcC
VPDFLTIKRVFQVISPKQFEKCFIEWTNEIMKNSGRVVISIDGKAMCGTADERLGKKAIHIVNAYCKANGIIIGQVKTEEKSNEIKAVPELLEMLCIQGCIVTVDALNTQKYIAKKIVKENKADYVFALKGNHKLLFEEVKTYFADALQETNEEAKTYEVYTTKEAGHGRIEKRIYRYSKVIDWMDARKDWEKLKGIGMVTRIVEKDGETRKEEAYYLCSVDQVEEFATAVRDHWGVESMHWNLDVTFREDAFKTIERNAAQNMAVLKRLALNMIKKDQERYPKRSLKLRRFIANLNTDYLDYLFQINFK